MKNGESSNTNKEIPCKVSTTNSDDANASGYSGLSKADIRALVLQELQIAGAGIKASPYRRRGRQISSNANVPRWTNLLKIKYPEVEKSPWMSMSRGGRISSNANVSRLTNLLECQCPEVDKSPQKPMSRGGQISLDVNVPRWTNILKC